MRISEPSFTDCGIDAAGNWIDQTRTRVDGRSAPSTLSLPMSQGREILGLSARGFLRPPRRGVPTHDPRPLGEFEGACPLIRAPPRACQAPHISGARRTSELARGWAECPAGQVTYLGKSNLLDFRRLKVWAVPPQPSWSQGIEWHISRNTRQPR